MLRVVVMVSGGGTNLQAIMDGVENGTITNTEIVGVISNNKNAYALERARNKGIPARCISPKEFSTREEFNQALLAGVDSYQPDLIVLAGFLVVIPVEMIQKYRNRIINIHPSLIPAFCGTGYYGLKVHEGGRGDGTFRGRGNRYRPDYPAKGRGGKAGRHSRSVAAQGDGGGRVGHHAPGD